MHAASVTRPHVLDDTGDEAFLRVRSAAHVDVRVPLDAITSVRRELRFTTSEKRTAELNLAVGAQTTITLELATPVRHFTFLGRRKDVTMIRPRSYDPEARYGDPARTGPGASRGREQHLRRSRVGLCEPYPQPLPQRQRRGARPPMPGDHRRRLQLDGPDGGFTLLYVHDAAVEELADPVLEQRRLDDVDALALDGARTPGAVGHLLRQVVEGGEHPLRGRLSGDAARHSLRGVAVDEAAQRGRAVGVGRGHGGVRGEVRGDAVPEDRVARAAQQRRALLEEGRVVRQVRVEGADRARAYETWCGQSMRSARAVRRSRPTAPSGAAGRVRRTPVPWASIRSAAAIPVSREICAFQPSAGSGAR